jgi:hypothetical protein
VTARWVLLYGGAQDVPDLILHAPRVLPRPLFQFLGDVVL